MSQVFTESPSYFSQILNVHLDNITSPQGSTSLKYVDDVFLSSSSQIFSQEDHSYLFFDL